VREKDTFEIIHSWSRKWMCKLSVKRYIFEAKQQLELDALTDDSQQ